MSDVVNVTVRGNRLALVGIFDEKMHEFCTRLPAANFKPGLSAWLADSSPAACWQVSTQAGFPVQLDGEAARLASRFHNSLYVKKQFDEIRAVGDWDSINRSLAVSPGKFKTPPWKHQGPAFAYGRDSDSPYFAMGMGTGKSWVATNIIGEMRAKRSLILCPNNVVDVWPREFRKHAGFDHHILPLRESTTTKRMESAKRFLFDMPGSSKVLVVNYETARSQMFNAFLTSINWDCAILDEIHRVKSPKGVTADMTHQLGRRSGKRIGLSGTPMPHSPLDIWSQYQFLDPGVFGSSYHSFQQRYCTRGEFKEVVEFINQEELSERFNLLAFTVDRSVLDLPPATHNKRLFELKPATMKAYRKLDRELIAEIENGICTADNALVKLLRHQQITSGFYSDDPTGMIVDLEDRAKEDALREILEDLPTQEPVVIFYRFMRDADTIARVCQEMGRRHGELSSRHKDLTSDATMPDWIDSLGCQIQSGGVGIDLARAKYAIYYSISFNMGDYDQSLARLHRPGQDFPVSYYHLVAENTVDERVYQAFEERSDIVRFVVNGERIAA